MQEYIEKPKIVMAEQWFPETPVKNVITDDPFIQTGHWSDRFSCHADVYVVIDNDKKGVNPGDWIVYEKNEMGKPSYVMNDEQFKLKFNKNKV